MRFKPGTILSVLSLSISLFVLAVYLIILIHINNMVKIVNEKTPFIVELKDSLSQGELDELITDFKTRDYIFDVNFISKADGIKLLSKELGEGILLNDETNPLKDIIRFKLKNDFIAAAKEKNLIAELEKNYTIDKCTFEKESIESLKNNLINLNSIFLFLGIVFILISFILIYNNLKFILHADRFTIKTMELIGASPSFVKRPYIKLAVKIGFLSAVISTLLLVIVLVFLDFKYDILNSIIDFKTVAFIVIIIVILSILTPPVFINSIVRKYLLLSDRGRYN